MAESKQRAGESAESPAIAEEAQSFVASLATTAQEKARELAEEKKRQAAEQVGDVARAVEGVAAEFERRLPPAGRYVRGAASEIERISSTLRDSSVDELIDAARDFARRYPTAVLGGCILAGFGLARFLKSSGERAMAAGARHAEPRRSASMRPAETGFAPGRAPQAGRQSFEQRSSSDGR